MADEKKITYFNQNLNGVGGEESPYPELPEGAPDPADYMQGNFPMGGPDPREYMPQFKTDPVLPTPEFASVEQNRMLLDSMRNNHNAAIQNPYERAKVVEFGAGMDDHQFERYYNHPEFDNLGFSPFRDNEALYNENSNWFEEMGRAFTQWQTLTGIGFTDSMGFGDLSDTDAAEKFERAMAIGSSSKGGFGGFTTNLFLNSGYTVGIMGELVAEELALAGLTALSLGTASEVTVPLMGTRLARAGKNIYSGLKTGLKLMKKLDDLRDVNKARTAFSSFKKAANFVNPLAETSNFIKNYNKLDNVGNLARNTMGFASFYRDVRNVRLAWGESGLEAGMVQNDIADELLEEHWRIHNRRPTDEEAEEMHATAVAAAKTTQFHNMWAIFYSNKIVFDNLFKGFSPVRRLTDELLETAGGKILQNRSLKKSPFEVVEKGYKGLFKSAKNPRGYARVGLNYFKANFAEGLQETAQETISGAAKDYHMAIYEGTPIQGGYWAAVGDNLQKQVSAQGFETFMSGFLMGGLVQGPQKFITNQSKKLWSKARGTYAQEKADQEEYLNETVNKLNDLYNDPKKYFAPDLANLVNQEKYKKGMDKARKEGDRKTYEDLKDASLQDHIYTALRTNKLDSILESLKAELNLTEKEIQQAHGMSKEDYTSAINTAIDRAKSIEQRYELVNEKYPNPFNPKAFKNAILTDLGKWEEESINHSAYESAQRDLVFMQTSFDNTLERMNSIMNEAKNDAALKNTPLSDFNALFSFETLQNEITALANELKPMAEVTTKEGKKLKKQKEKKRELLEEFADAMGEYMASPAVEHGVVADDAQLNRVYKAYDKYLKHIGNVNKDYVFDESSQKAFQKILDYYQLDIEARKLNSSVNTLIDRSNFAKHAERHAEVMNEVFNDKKAQIEKALREWLKIKDTNDLMQEMHAAGMFFDPQELKALMDHGIFPTTFYYVKSKEEVLTTSNDYVTAQSILEKYTRKTDTDVTKGKASPYNAGGRNKINDDKRTYKDLAQEYGFDPEASSTKVPLKQVLQTIIDSKYATVQEKALAARLLSIAKEGEFVDFVNDLANPGVYGKEIQTKIDGRYHAHDFKNGGQPIEETILHEEIHRRTVAESYNDPVFAETIKDMLVKAKAHMALPETQEKWGEKPLYGLKNEREFIAEAMSSVKFQEFLAEIPYDDMGSSAWTEFVDSVIRMLKKLFGREVSNTALNGAIAVITAKIDQSYGSTTGQTAGEVAGELEPGDYQKLLKLAKVIAKGQQPNDAESLQLQNNYGPLLEQLLEIEKTRKGDLLTENLTDDERKEINDTAKAAIKRLIGTPAGPKKKKVIPQAEGGVKLTSKMDVAELNQPEFAQLKAEIIQLYKDENARREREEESPLHPMWSEHSDDQILATRQFKSFFKNWSSVKKALKKFNDATGRTQTPTRQTGGTTRQAGSITGDAPAIKTREMQDALLGLGYTQAEVNALSPGEANILIQEGLSKEERAAMEDAAGEAERQELAEQKIKIREEIAEIIAAANNLEELNAAEIELHNILIDPNLRRVGEITSEYIQNLIKVKKEQLAFNFTFEDIQEGEVIMLNDNYNTKVVVDRKTAKMLYTHRVGDVTKRYNIKKGTVANRVKYRYSPAMEEVTVTPEAQPTAEEEVLSNQALEEVVNNPDATQQMVDDARQGGETGWLDNINEC